MSPAVVKQPFGDIFVLYTIIFYFSFLITFFFHPIHNCTRIYVYKIFSLNSVFLFLFSRSSPFESQEANNFVHSDSQPVIMSNGWIQMSINCWLNYDFFSIDLFIILIIFFGFHVFIALGAMTTGDRIKFI